jgi:hypothetical protein
VTAPKLCPRARILSSIQQNEDTSPTIFGFVYIGRDCKSLQARSIGFVTPYSVVQKALTSAPKTLAKRDAPAWGCVYKERVQSP